jgi:excisionase family DNA binding protein
LGLAVKKAPPSKILTVTELAALLKVSRASVYHAIKAGRLPAFRIGSDWRFNVEQIEAWMRRENNQS